MRSLIQFFIHLDIYGKIPSFTINGDKKYRTIFGAIISIITYSLIIYFFFIETRDIFNHKNPKILSSTYIDNNTSINLTKNNFIMTLSLQNPDYSSYIDESIYNIKAYLLSTILNEEKTIELTTPLELIKCSEYKFKFLNDYWINIDLNDMYCLDHNDIELSGNFKNTKWNVLFFEFSKCINSTKNNYSCESKEIIEEKLKGGYIGIFMSDLTIDLNNFSTPTKYYGKNLFTTISYLQYTDYWIYLKDLIITTDDGYFFENKQSKFYFSVDEVERGLDNRNSNIFLKIGLRKSNRKEIYMRSYIKIQEAIGNICGLIKFITICGEIITVFFQKLLYQNFIIQFIDFSKKNKQKFSISKYHINDNSHSIFKNFNDADLEMSINKTKTFINSNYLFEKDNKLNMNENISNKTYVISKKHFQDNKNRENEDSFYNNVNNNLFKNEKHKILKGYSYTIDVSKLKKKHFTSKIAFIPILCDKESLKKINLIYEKFNLIKYCFDIIQYLKIQFEIGVIKNRMFNEEINNEIKGIYYLNYNVFTEKEGYDKIFKRISFSN